MPNNPLTEQELYEYGILRSLTPPAEVVGLVPPYFPAGYFLVPPYDVDGPVLWRKFNAGYISEGIIDPNRLGTGAVGDGNLYLADDGTWKAVSGGGGGAVDRIIAGTNISISPTSGTGDVTINATTLVPDPTGYGSFFSNQTQAISVIDTPQVVTFNNTYEANDVYLSSNRIYFNKAGTYQFAYIAQVFNAANSVEHCSFWIRYNGNNFPNSATHITVNARKSSTEPSEQQMKLILSGTAQNDGDYIELYWQGTTTSLSLGYIAAGPGEAPVNSPSVIANIIPIGAQGRDSNLNELNDVTITSPVNNQLLRYNSGIWENWTPNFLTTVPTLDQVTTAGNTTTNAITVGGLTVATNLIYTDTVNGTVGIGKVPFSYNLDVNGSFRAAGLFTITSSGRTQINTSGGSDGLKINDTSNGILIIQGGSKSYRFITLGGNQQLQIRDATNSDATRLAIATTGNVLIGATTDAGYKLDVNGTLRTTGNITTDSSIVGPSPFLIYSQFSNRGRIDLWSANALPTTPQVQLLTDGNVRMSVTKEGNVGIGITTPTSKFQVFGSITAASALARGVYFNNTLVAAANNDVLVGLDIAPTFTNGAFTGVSNIAARVNGNLITEYASARITATPTSNAQSHGFNSRSGSEERMFAGYIGSSSLHGTTLSAYFGSPAGYKISFGIANTIRQTIFTNGNITIGTTTDSGYKLDVNGTARVTGILYANSTINQPTSFGNKLLFMDSANYSKIALADGNNWSLDYHSGTTVGNLGYHRFYTGSTSGWVERLRIENNGNIGIGTAAPTYKLQVAGTVSAQLTNATQTNQVYYDSTTGELTYGASSGGGAQFVIDYDYNITGVKDGSNTNFSTTVPYKPGTTRVYLNGQRLTPGAEYDYLEISTTQIGMFYAPVPSDRLIIEYETI
jgi:hypothetical protein